MSKYCMLCRNMACQNHGKNITLFGDSWQCDYIPTPTNADRIRAMSDEELAEFLAEEQFRIANVVFQTVGYGLEKQAIYAQRLDWLQQLAEEDT